jgi:hypothetical protein
MKIKALLFVSGCCFLFELSAQLNLVPNPSFEVYDTCPTSASQIRRAIPWFQPNNPSWSGSSDFYHTCSATWSPPSNMFGYQAPYTGNGYSGIGLFCWPQDSACHEYLEVELNDTLVPGNKYCVSFVVSLAESSGAGSSSIGVYFSPDTCQYSSSYWSAIPVTPQLSLDTDNVIIDKINWVRIEWQYTAMGNERFMTIGNFRNPPDIHYECLLNPCQLSYYYFDDFAVTGLPVVVAGLNDTICLSDSTLLSGGISEFWPGMQFEWLPHIGLSDPYSLTTQASPLTSLTYTLNVSCATCGVSCLDDVKDSVRISVVPSITTVHVDSICFGDTAILNGSISELWNGMQFEWLPHSGLNDPYSLNPIASPGVTTTYTLTVNCPSCTQPCFSQVMDTTLLIVNPNCTADGELNIPTLIGQGDQWVVLNLPVNTGARIYDVRGRLVFESADYRNDWFVFQARGTYAYELNFASGEKKSGKIVVQ